MQKTFRKKNLIILIILLILIPMVLQRSIKPELVQFNEDNSEKRPKTSVVYADILIDDTMTANTTNQGNWTWAVSQPWCSGEGTPEEPYIIENEIFVSTGGECLVIANSRKNFIIRNCIINSSNLAGLYLENVTNGQILNNYVFDNYIGFALWDVNDTIISNNEIYSTTLDGVFLQYGYSNIISENIVYNNTENGIDLKDSNFNILKGNIIYNNAWSGDEDERSGIFIWTSHYNVLAGNKVYNNSKHGIRLKTCNFNNISENVIYNNTGNGINLITSDLNNLTGNEVFNNTEEGIYLWSCENNTLLDNSLTNNYDCGLKTSSSYNNTILENIINANIEYGIYILASVDNIISQNSIQNNSIGGIRIETSDYNEIYENKIWSNTYIGVYLDDGDTKSDYNLLYYNFFIGNGIHAFDGPDNTDNNWNNTNIGNYWDNYTETHPNLAIDADDNGIGDVPYNISLSPLIQDHLPIFDNDMPIITIYSPTPGYIFDNIAPSFNVIITDDYLDEMWYTIDSGLHNYSFTENGMINQYAWNCAAEGNITLTFYASDKPGNIGTEEVMITKDYIVPTVNINSPTSGVFFGSSAPSFNVRITDDYLDTMWYTIDGGLHNYTFTVNGTIVQSAWNMMDDGAILLGFFANDTLGHIGSSGVNLLKDTVAPTIIITSPAEGERFGSTAPMFNITITEINLDEIWYSYDEGLTTYTITDNGTLNQAAWTALAQGEVNLTFYAKDLAGNEASERVTVIKSISAGGLNPAIIIAIVIVSIVGGVAVVAVGYLFMKKRATPELIPE